MKKKILIPFTIILFLLTFNIACVPLGGGSGSEGPSPRLLTEADENIEVYFAPAQDIHQHIIDRYDHAQKFIHVAIYSLTKNEFADALIRAHQRGVEVKILIDKAQAGKTNEDERLEAAGIKVWRSKGSRLMHNKISIIDGSIVITGSYNYTKNASKNDENYVIIKDKEIGELFENRFQILLLKHR
jgi:phosphatidylserine/phosphatidylglycerophosphate/cardiolipin synthase-like enzyme